MKVIFIQNVAKQGKIGEIKEVADGFATNVLIPKKQAIIATPQAIKKLNLENKEKEIQLENKTNNFLKFINELEELLNKESNGFLEIEIKNKEKNGSLFSQIKETDILEALFKKTKISLDKNQIILSKNPIKKIGQYQIKIISKNIEKTFKILVK